MQAVVLLLDSPSGGFTAPLGLGSWALPIGECPVVELTLRWLERSAIHEALVVTSASSAKPLNDYLHGAGWLGDCRRGMVVQVLTAPACASEGEALRFVEAKDVIKDDFVLVSGSVVGNAELGPAMQAHVARRTADRQALMTLLLSCGSPVGGSPATLLEYVVAVDSRTQQLLKLDPSDGPAQVASLGTQVFGERDAVTVRMGVRLASVYICSPDALVLLSDNFDYQSLAGDLVPGVLSEQELGSTLYTHELARGYVERVCTRASYSVVVDDAVNRWTYPWVPDNTGHPEDSCRFNRGTYVDASAAVASGCRLSKGSMVGRRSRLDAGVRLEHCIVGTNCHIGSNATLQGCCLHANVCIGEGCRLSFATLAEHAVVRDQACVQTASLLARHTVVDAAQSVPAGSCVSLIQPSNATGVGSDDDADHTVADPDHLEAAEAAAAALASGGIPETSLGFDEHVVGTFGAGYLWAAHTQSLPTAADVFSTVVAGGNEDDSEAGDFIKDIAASDDATCLEHNGQASDPFQREVAETILRCIKENITHENAVIELNGLKIAEDRTFADCARYMFTTILSLCLPPGPNVKAEYCGLFNAEAPDVNNDYGCRRLLSRLNAKLKDWKDLLSRFLKSNDDQVELLLTFEEYCAEEGDRGATFAKLFPQVVKLCYDHDLLSEDAILEWADEKEQAAAEDRHFVERCSDLVDWLKDAEEESSDGSD